MAGVCAARVFFLASRWTTVAFLWIGLDGWLFGGLILLGPPAMSFSEDFFCVSVYIIVNTELHGFICYH